MTNYTEPRTGKDVIGRAAKDSKAFEELIKQFESCERQNQALYQQHLEAHRRVLEAIQKAGFYNNSVLRYMVQQQPDGPKSLARLKKKVMARIETERKRLIRSQQRRDYRQRYKEKTEAAIVTLTEHGYEEWTDYSPYRAITFLKSITDVVEVPENSGNWQRVIRYKVAGLLPEGEMS